MPSPGAQPWTPDSPDHCQVPGFSQNCPTEIKHPSTGMASFGQRSGSTSVFFPDLGTEIFVGRIPLGEVAQFASPNGPNLGSSPYSPGFTLGVAGL